MDRCIEFDPPKASICHTNLHALAVAELQIPPLNGAPIDSNLTPSPHNFDNQPRTPPFIPHLRRRQLSIFPPHRLLRIRLRPRPCSPELLPLFHLRPPHQPLVFLLRFRARRAIHSHPPLLAPPPYLLATLRYAPYCAPRRRTEASTLERRCQESHEGREAGPSTRSAASTTSRHALAFTEGVGMRGCGWGAEGGDEEEA